MPATWSRHRAARASRPGGICCMATPAVSSRLASASAGSTGRWPGVWACSGTKNCPSGKLAGQPVRGVHREGCLADPRHPVDGMDARLTPPSACRAGRRSQQPRQLGLAPGEAADVARQGPDRCCLRPRRGRVAPVPAARTSAAGARPRAAATNSARTGPVRLQRVGQQQGGVLARGAVDAALQVADRPRADARRLGQFLLRQPGPRPEPPQQVGETQRRLRHRHHLPLTRAAGPGQPYASCHPASRLLTGCVTPIPGPWWWRRLG